MKLIIILLVVCLFVPRFDLCAQKLQKIGEINMEVEELKKKFDYKNIEYMTFLNKKIGKFYSFRMDEILEAHTGSMNLVSKEKLLFIAESKTGITTLLTLHDIDPRYTVITPFVLYEEVGDLVSDTISIKDIDNELLNVDLEAVGREFDRAITTRINIQLSKISESDKAKYFRKGAFIIPTDAGPGRWLTNIKKILIYMVIDE